MGLILTVLSSILSKSVDFAKSLAIAIKNAFLTARGFLFALFLHNAHSIVLQVLTFTVVFLLANTAFQSIWSLLVSVGSWVSIVEAVRDLSPTMMQGVFSSVWQSLALDHFFNSVVMCFSAWISGWTVYKSVEYTVIIRKFGVWRGFWRTLPF